MELRCLQTAENNDETQSNPSRREDSNTEPPSRQQPASGNVRLARSSALEVPDKPYLFLEDEVHAFNALVKASASEHSARGDTDRAAANAGSSPNIRTRISSQEKLTTTWGRCWLVKNNWITAAEALWYIDRFFQTMGPMTTILSDFFSHSENHEFLIVYEPLLCYTILTISSSVNVLPSTSNSPPHELVHAKCWEITKTLCQRVLWAQETGSKSKIRTLGTVLALLLLIEWPPRTISLPPDEMPDYICESDGPSVSTVGRGGSGTLEDEERHIRLVNASRWMTKLSQPIIRSDRISGMLLGMAESLAAELDIIKHTRFRGNECPKDIKKELFERYRDRRARVRLLLYLHFTQSTTTFGLRFEIHRSASEDIAIIQDLSQREEKPEEAEWLHALGALAKLSQIANEAKKILFCSTEHSAALVDKGEHLMWLAHFRSLMSKWLEETESLTLSSPISEIVHIEYQTLHIRLCSLSVEAISKRLLSLKSSSNVPKNDHHAIDDYLVRVLSSVEDNQDDYENVGKQPRALKLYSHLPSTWAISIV